MAKRFKKRLMIDLDGVLNDYDGTYKVDEIPNIKEGAREFIQKLFAQDEYELILFTTRSKDLAFDWLMRNDLYVYFTDVTDIKSTAFIYLDDRAVNFKGDFEETFDTIKNFRVYWKK